MTCLMVQLHATKLYDVIRNYFLVINGLKVHQGEKMCQFHRLFTDESKTDLGVGWAVYCPQTSRYNMYKMRCNLSIFKAEILAIYFCFHTRTFVHSADYS